MACARLNCRNSTVFVQYRTSKRCKRTKGIPKKGSILRLVVRVRLWFVVLLRSKKSFATTGLGRYLICGSEKRLRSDLRFVVRRNVKLSQSALGSQTRLVTSGICNHLSCSLVRQISPVILTAYLRCVCAVREEREVSRYLRAGNCCKAAASAQA